MRNHRKNWLNHFQNGGIVMLVKKGVSFILALVLITTSGVFVSAAGTDELKESKIEKLVNNIDCVVGARGIKNTLEEEQGSFLSSENGTKVTISKGDTGAVKIKSDASNSIDMHLPATGSDQNPVLIDKGTVLYGSGQSDSNVGVQLSHGKIDGISYQAVNALVVINNANAAKEYSFKFDAPPKFSLVKENFVEGNQTRENICMKNDYGERLFEIPESCAVDAQGKVVKSYFKIESGKLTQIVNIDKDVKFPVISKVEILKAGNGKEQVRNVYDSNFSYKWVKGRPGGAKWVKFPKNKGSLYYSTSGGPTVSASVSLGASFGYGVISINIGTDTSSSHHGVCVEVPDSKHYFRLVAEKKIKYKKVSVQRRYRKWNPKNKRHEWSPWVTLSRRTESFGYADYIVYTERK